ncbi:hypothetical protein ABB02_00740 [Clostridiaceae bacterium JG1575]|nr:hypothetical protein ABB02_00740 [Clostridiaceae bacterium JG1575]
MVPLIFSTPGQEVMIGRVGGTQEVKKHLEHLGFVPGQAVTVVSMNAGNLIVKVHESRIAISREMAQKILVG